MGCVHVGIFFIKYREEDADNIIRDIQQLGVELEYKSPILPILAVKDDEDKKITSQLVKNYELIYVKEDAENGSLLNEGSLSAVTNFVQLMPKIEHKALRNEGFTGWGVTIAIIDSGISEDWVSEHKDFTGFGSSPLVNHGTIVGTIVKTFSRGAKIISCKVAQNFHNIKQIDVLNAIDYAIQQNVQVINLSLGFKNIDCTDSAPCVICDSVNTYSRSKDVLFVTAAGNDGDENSIRCPGNAQEPITVGSIKKQLLEVAEYSSKGSPGGTQPNILTSGSIYYNQHPDQGTSYSTPVISGVSGALMTTQQALNISEIKNYLYSTAKKIPDTPDHHQGFGVFDIEKLLEVLKYDSRCAKSQGQIEPKTT
jgi:subtilisin family serine protease